MWFILQGSTTPELQQVLADLRAERLELEHVAAQEVEVRSRQLQIQGRETADAADATAGAVEVAYWGEGANATRTDRPRRDTHEAAQTESFVRPSQPKPPEAWVAPTSELFSSEEVPLPGQSQLLLSEDVLVPVPGSCMCCGPLS